MSCAFSAPWRGFELPNVPFASLTLRWAMCELRFQRDDLLFSLLNQAFT
ncbi:MAG: hypothetical protein IKP62_12160 [Salinivirgaceae bacterium]|nr:hypothetical protein [Salinivirgaceae bacterium]